LSTHFQTQNALLYVSDKMSNREGLAEVERSARLLSEELLDGEVGGLCPLQDLVHEGGSPPDE
jgi:hypothetical protein